MRPLIGVTTSELRSSSAGTLRRHGEPPHPEMALGMTYLRAIEAIIRRHEPRFSNVKVHLVEDRQNTFRTLHFRVEAVLRVEPAPESVLYDSQVDLLSRTFRVQV